MPDNELDFTLELSSDTLNNAAEYDMFVLAEEQLRPLADGHDDLTSAAVNIRPVAAGDAAHEFEATVVLYARPAIISASEKAFDPKGALQGALDAAEKQLRKKRERLGKPWEQPGAGPVAEEVTELLLAQEAVEKNKSDQ